MDSHVQGNPYSDCITIRSSSFLQEQRKYKGIEGYFPRVPKVCVVIRLLNTMKHKLLASVESMYILLASRIFSVRVHLKKKFKKYNKN